jgi:3-deoxy-D-manno-octulosonate 8-phosphate phosphatase (KDO 8-P phosphatase)
MNIKILVMDVDGTLTDGRINTGSNGELFKSFNVKDGFAIKELMPKAGIVPVIITDRNSEIVSTRVRELGVTEFHQGVAAKAALLREIAAKFACELSNVAYIGDDLNDYAAMQLCGFKACPADAAAEIRGLCDYVSPFGGGHGAVRDICEYIVKQSGKWGEVLRLFEV